MLESVGIILKNCKTKTCNMLYSFWEPQFVSASGMVGGGKEPKYFFRLCLTCITPDFPYMSSKGGCHFKMNYIYILGGGFECFYFHPYLGKISILTNIFQMGWFNHQPDICLTQAFPSRRKKNCCADLAIRANETFGGKRVTEKAPKMTTTRIFV